MEIYPTPTYPTHPYLPPLIPTPHTLPPPNPTTLTTTHPYYPIPPLTPTQNNGLERSQFIDNVKHGLEGDWFCQ